MRLNNTSATLVTALVAVLLLQSIGLSHCADTQLSSSTTTEPTSLNDSSAPSKSPHENLTDLDETSVKNVLLSNQSTRQKRQQEDLSNQPIREKRQQQGGGRRISLRPFVRLLLRAGLKTIIFVYRGGKFIWFQVKDFIFYPIVNQVIDLVMSYFRGGGRTDDQQQDDPRYAQQMPYPGGQMPGGDVYQNYDPRLQYDPRMSQYEMRGQYDPAAQQGMYDPRLAGTKADLGLTNDPTKSYDVPADQYQSQYQQDSNPQVIQFPVPKTPAAAAAA